MEQFAKNRPWFSWILIVVGTGLMAVAIQNIYDPVNMVVGGFTGIAIILKNVTEPIIEGGLPLWLTNLVLNIPVFLLSWKIKGIRFIGRTGMATVLLSVWLYLIPQGNIVGEDYVLASVFGGALSGVGIGLIFLARATTGGTDMVAALIQHKLRHYSIAQIMQIIDGTVVLMGLYVFGIHAALYAIVSIFIMSKISDGMLGGFRYSKAAFIITEKHEEVAEKIMEELDRGITGLKAKGMYSGQQKCMLYCVVSKKEIVALKELVLSIDKNAFVIVNDVREVLGEGFIEYLDN